MRLVVLIALHPLYSRGRGPPSERNRPPLNTFREVLPVRRRVFRALLMIPNLRLLAMVQFLTNLTFYSTVIVAYQTERGRNGTRIF